LKHTNFATLRDLRNLGCPQELAQKLSRWNMTDFTEPIFHVNPNEVNTIIADFLRANPSQRPSVNFFLIRLNLLRKVKRRTAFLRDIYGPHLIAQVEENEISWNSEVIKKLVGKLNQSLGDKIVFRLTGTQSNIKRALMDDDYFWSLASSRTWDISLEDFSFELYDLTNGFKSPQQIKQELVDFWTKLNRNFPPFYWSFPTPIITFNYP